MADKLYGDWIRLQEIDIGKRTMGTGLDCGRLILAKELWGLDLTAERLILADELWGLD